MGEGSRTERYARKKLTPLAQLENTRIEGNPHGGMATGHGLWAGMNTLATIPPNEAEGTSREQEDKISRSACSPSDVAMFYSAFSLRSGQCAPGGPLAGFFCLWLWRSGSRKGGPTIREHGGYICKHAMV